MTNCKPCGEKKRRNTIFRSTQRNKTLQKISSYGILNLFSGTSALPLSRILLMSPFPIVSVDKQSILTKASQVVHCPPQSSLQQ